MRSTSAAGTGCILRALWLYLLFVVGTTIVAVSVGYVVAGFAVRRAEKGWAEDGESMEAFAARFPTHPDSPAALDLDRMARPMGLRMCRANDTGSEPYPGPNDEVLTAIGTMITSCGAEGKDACSALSPEGAAFLRGESSRLDAIEAHILEGGRIEWDLDITKGVAAPIPSLLGHRFLHNLLLARAVEHTRRGRGDAAARSLEASWRLNQSLGERPALLSRLMTIAVAGMQQGVLRTLKHPPEPWLERVRDRRFAADIRTPFQYEAWGWTRFTTGLWGFFDISYMENGEEPPRTAAGTVGRVVSTPYMRLSFANTSEELLRATRELTGGVGCDLDVEQYAEDFKEALPRWNILGRIATPSVVRAWSALEQADFDRELTERVLVARMERARSGRWPSDPVPSTLCEGTLWEQRPRPDGTLVIDVDEQPFAPVDGKTKSWSVRLQP